MDLLPDVVYKLSEGNPHGRVALTQCVQKIPEGVD